MMKPSKRCCLACSGVSPALTLVWAEVSRMIVDKYTTFAPHCPPFTHPLNQIRNIDTSLSSANTNITHLLTTMNNTSALMDIASLSLLQNIREDMQSGRIDDMKTAQAAVEAAIDELLFKGATQNDDSLVR